MIKYFVTRLLLPSSVVLALASCSASPTTESTTTKTTPKNDGCVTLPLSSVPKGRQPQEYKEELKRQTGAKCIFWDINR